MTQRNSPRYRIILAVLRVLLAAFSFGKAVAIYDVPPLLMLHQQPGLSVPLVPIDEDRWA